MLRIKEVISRGFISTQKDSWERSWEMSKMHRLEIREPHIVNNCKGSYERKAAPVSHTWRYRCVAISEDKQALTEYAERLPLEMFYQGDRKYRIE